MGVAQSFRAAFFICCWEQQMVADHDYGFGSATRDNAARHSLAMIETGLQQLTPVATRGKRL